MDDADRAKSYETLDRKIALDATLTRKPKENPIVIDGVTHCNNCGCVIPQARLDAVPDAARCIDCEQLKEEER